MEFGSWGQHDVTKIKEAVTKNNLKVGCFSGDKDYNLIDPAHRKEFIEYLAKSIDVAHYLNCKNLVLHSNALGENGKHVLIEELKYDGIFAFELSPKTTMEKCIEALKAF
ncbi:MAG: hypothetical protein GX184_03955 [Clostridiaceae bacterium]|nr:hypothetical protein [Clostridiaceae bacterium]